MQLGGPSANLLHADQPLPDRVTFTFKGKVNLDPNQAGPVDVRITADLSDNPQLTGRVETILPVGPDGGLDHKLTLFFNKPTPRELHFEATVIGPAGLLAERTIRLELVDLTGFLSLIEPLAPAIPSLDFVASVRKNLLPNPLFNVAIGRAAAVKSIFPEGTYSAQRLQAYKLLLAGGSLVDIGHVIIGIEGAARSDPQPRWLIPRVDLVIPRVDFVVSWAGDLGSAVQEWLWAKYYLKKPNTGPTPEALLDELASKPGLVGDLDGVNLAAAYQTNLSLAENLQRYYDQDAENRFALFLDNTRRDDGSQALTLEPNAAPRLTSQSRTFIAEQSSNFATLALLQALLSTPRFKDKTHEPDEVRAALQPDSPEFQLVTDYFAEFLEHGLQ